MALKTVNLGVSNTHAVTTGARPVKLISHNRVDSTHPYNASANTRSFAGGSPEMSGTYRPTPMPTVRIFIPYQNKFSRGIV